MAKLFKNLYDQIYHPTNLWWAYKNAAKGKRYTPSVAAFEYDLEKNLIELENELKTETCELGGYHSFEIALLRGCHCEPPATLAAGSSGEAISSQAGRLPRLLLRYRSGQGSQ